jgi:hypothetical protein
LNEKRTDSAVFRDVLDKTHSRSFLRKHAAKDSSTETLSALLAADTSGASLSAKDDFGQLAIDVALINYNYDAVTCILKADSEIASLPDTYRARSEEVVKLQVQNGDELYPIIDYHRHLKGLQPHIRSWNSEGLICDRCRSKEEAPYYNCKLCNDADYDICEQCFDKGYRCKDDTHVLRRCLPWHNKWVFESWLRTAWETLNRRCSEQNLEDGGQRDKDEEERKLLQQYIEKGWSNPDGDMK